MTKPDMKVVPLPNINYADVHGRLTAIANELKGRTDVSVIVLVCREGSRTAIRTAGPRTSYLEAVGWLGLTHEQLCSDGRTDQEEWGNDTPPEGA